MSTDSISTDSGYSPFNLIGLTQDMPEINKYKEIIKQQHNQTCNNNFEKEYVSGILNTFSYGYIYLDPKAQNTRRTKTFGDKHSVVAFILCFEDPDSKTILIQLVCAAQKLGLGENLVKAVIEDCISTGASFIELYALNEPSLVRWYERFGFKKIPNQAVSHYHKLQHMRLFLKH